MVLPALPVGLEAVCRAKRAIRHQSSIYLWHHFITCIYAEMNDDHVLTHAWAASSCGRDRDIYMYAYVT